MLTFAAPLAFAGPPFITDDPVPVDPGHGEFYIATMATDAKGEIEGTLPHFEFNYGPIENVQLHVIAPLSFAASSESNSFDYGYGDTELGAKIRFIKEDSLFDGCPEIATFPLVELQTGDHQFNLGQGEAQEFIPLWLQKSFGDEKHPWTVYGGGGYWFNPGEGNKNYTFVGAVLQKQVTDTLALGGELFYATSSADGEDPHLGFNLGGILDLSEDWHLLLSVGRDIQGDNHFTGYAAILYTF
jgi:hypothetical protein